MKKLILAVYTNVTILLSSRLSCNKVKQNIKMLSIALILTILSSSCGSNDKKFDKNIELKAKDVKIKGYLSDVLEIVGGTYKFNYTVSQYLGEGKIEIKIKSIKKGNIKDYGLEDQSDGPLYLTICDKNGTPFNDFASIESEYIYDDSLKDMMRGLGKEKWIAFQGFAYQGKNLPSNAATFIITSKKIEKSKESISSGETSTSSNVLDKDPYEIMHVAFEGSPEISEIKPMLESVMDNYDFQKNNDSRLKIANMLVSLRKESAVGVTEIQILKHIYQNGSNQISLPEQAGLSATLLEIK